MACLNPIESGSLQLTVNKREKSTLLKNVVKLVSFSEIISCDINNRFQTSHNALINISIFL